MGQLRHLGKVEAAPLLPEDAPHGVSGKEDVQAHVHNLHARQFLCMDATYPWQVCTPGRSCRGMHAHQHDSQGPVDGGDLELCDPHVDHERDAQEGEHWVGGGQSWSRCACWLQACGASSNHGRCTGPRPCEAALRGLTEEDEERGEVLAQIAVVPTAACKAQRIARHVMQTAAEVGPCLSYARFRPRTSGGRAQ